MNGAGGIWRKGFGDTARTAPSQAYDSSARAQAQAHMGIERERPALLRTLGNRNAGLLPDRNPPSQAYSVCTREGEVATQDADQGELRREDLSIPCSN